MILPTLVSGYSVFALIVSALNMYHFLFTLKPVNGITEQLYFFSFSELKMFAVARDTTSNGHVIYNISVSFSLMGAK